MQKQANALKLPHYNVLSVDETDSSRTFYTEISCATTHCPHCSSDDMVSFGRRNEIILDIPRGGKQTKISLNRRRHRCKQCRKTFYEHVPHKSDCRQMTIRLVRYIMRECLFNSLNSIAGLVGVDEKTVRNIFNDYCNSIAD